MNFHIAYRFQILNFGEKKSIKANQKTPSFSFMSAFTHHPDSPHCNSSSEVEGRGCGEGWGGGGVVMCDGGDQGPGTTLHG